MAHLKTIFYVNPVVYSGLLNQIQKMRTMPIILTLMMVMEITTIKTLTLEFVVLKNKV